MPPSTPSSMILRTVFRRHIEHLRISRIPRRFQSQSTTTTTTSVPKPNEAAKPPAVDPVPVGGTPAAAPGFWSRLGPLTKAGQAYARAQKNRPWTTQIVSALVIYLAADISAQSIGGKEYVPERTARNLVVGGVSAVPNFMWFVWLSKHFNYQSHALSIGVKIVVNQLTFTPIFNSYFFGAQALLAGDSLAETWDRVRRTVPISWLNAWKLWPAVTAFSFTFVPMEYRSVFAGVVAVGWQTYLSYLNRQVEIEEETKAAESSSAVEKAALQVNMPRNAV
ncbi:uncharacterized protein F4822DRAFT_408823 [Hypoxylon trugodes]|uniref:uncharacterized protein n=1 Tax=Hypoxylon trugodes TaxID=326681 RepID=UPI002190EE33|nr:uncharacterized protein F4822DRAFT_408823 [Hypoxylon trugodes]KAI1386051.1 hypothetical protein F4822DRAFT_408823 [Hypoxylon trugodes]